MMKSNPTSDCNRCRMCPDTSKWHSGTFYCPATKLITPNMPKWCRHYDPDENAVNRTETAQKSKITQKMDR